MNPNFAKRDHAERLMHVMIKFLEGKYLKHDDKHLAKVFCEEICIELKIASFRLTWCL